MPVKDGDTVYFKIKSGKVLRGKYNAEKKEVMLYASGGEKAKPPKKALHHTRKGAMDSAFVKLKGSSDVLGAPKRYGKAKQTVNDKKTSMYELKGDGIYKPSTYQLKSVFTQEGFRSLPKSEFKRMDSEVASGEGTAISNFTDKKAKEYRKFLKENNVFSEGLTFQKVRPDNIQFYQYAFKKLADSRKKKENANEKPTPTKASMNKMIVIKVRNYGRGVNKSELNGFRKLSQKEVFGAKSKAQPGNLGNEYYLKEVKSESDKKELTDLSMGYPKEIQFFSISSLNKKFGTMGEKTISHSSIRKGDY